MALVQLRAPAPVSLEAAVEQDAKLALVTGAPEQPIAAAAKLFYVAAQAIERLLEPFASLIKPTQQKAEERDEKVAAAIAEPTQANAQAAADAQAAVEKRRANRTIAFWACATILGMAVAAGLKLYFLQVVGIEDAPRTIEILATGLVISGGTKPLHDLITRIQPSKEKPATTG